MIRYIIIKRGNGKLIPQWNWLPCAGFGTLNIINTGIILIKFWSRKNKHIITHKRGTNVAFMVLLNEPATNCHCFVCFHKTMQWPFARYKAVIMLFNIQLIILTPCLAPTCKVYYPSPMYIFLARASYIKRGSRALQWFLLSTSHTLFDLYVDMIAAAIIALLPCSWQSLMFQTVAKV